MKEALKNRRIITLGIALALGGYILGGRKDKEAPALPIKDASVLIQFEGQPAQVDYFTDGSREIRIFDSQNNIIKVYDEKCEHSFLDGNALKINEMVPTVNHPASDKDLSFSLGVVQRSRKCQDAKLTPTDFADNEAVLR